MLKKSIVFAPRVCLFLSFLVFACSSPKETIVMGMGLPLTGKMADYGQKIKKGAELALQEINSLGGINGRVFEIDFQDDQADPKQALALASKFIADPKVLMASEFGSAPAIAAASLYQKAGLVLCGFFSAHPGLTKSGDFIWGTAPLLSKLGMAFASYMKDLGIKNPAIFFLNNDWGKEYSDHIVETFVQLGIKVRLCEAYLPEEKDFRPLISKAKAQGVDGFALVSYLPDASLLVQQIRAQGLAQPICAADTVAVGDQFPKMAGHSAERVYISVGFYPDESRPEVIEFNRKWNAKHSKVADVFSIQAYDGVILAAYALRLSERTRSSVQQAMTKLKDVPSVINHKVSFNPSTRRIEDFLGARLIVKNGKVVRLEATNKK